MLINEAILSHSFHFVNIYSVIGGKISKVVTNRPHLRFSMIQVVTSLSPFEFMMHPGFISLLLPCDTDASLIFITTYLLNRELDG